MIRTTLERVRNSLFFVPALFIAGSGFLAWVAVTLDRNGWATDAPILLPTSAEGARAVLGAIAGATITVAALVFSLTAVTVQLAASQYSPRVLSEFLSDRFQQLVVGIVVGTFTFSLIALGTVVGDAAWAATIATGLGIATVVAIVGLIDHVMRRLHVDDIVRRLSHRTTDRLREAFAEEPHQEGGAVESELAKDLVAETLPSVRTGWVQRVNAPQLLARLGPAEVARLEARAGQYIVAGEPLLTVWRSESTGDAEVQLDAYVDLVQIGDIRTIKHDPSFGLRQLVDIALRALSPGINDPTTAGDVLHHLVEPLRIVLEGHSRPRVMRGEEGRRLALPKEPAQADFVRAAFSEIRLAATGQTHVGLALAQTLIALRRLTTTDAGVAVLDEQFVLLVDAVRGWGLPDVDLAQTYEAFGTYRRVADQPELAA